MLTHKEKHEAYALAKLWLQVWDELPTFTPNKLRPEPTLPPEMHALYLRFCAELLQERDYPDALLLPFVQWHPHPAHKENHA